MPPPGRLLLGIDLIDDDLAFVLTGKLFENRSHHAAGAAPRCVEIDDRGFVARYVSDDDALASDRL